MSSEKNEPLEKQASLEPKENNDNEKTNARKRPSLEGCDDDDHKRPRTQEAPLDTANVVGFKAGDRIEVRWEITDDVSGETTSRWWGATLMEHDGRTTDDGVAIRVLDYDPCLEWDYPERSLESVVFGNEFFLIDPDSLDQLFYRKEGEESVIGLDEEDLREELNGMLVGIMDKHKSLWQGLDAAKQAQIGEVLANGKEALIATMQKRFEEEKRPISAAEIPAILEEAFAGLQKEE